MTTFTQRFSQGGINWHRLVACLLILFTVAIFLPQLACADDPPDEIQEGTCTSQDEIFGIEEPASGEGLISSIIYEIGQPLMTVSQTMFQAIAGDDGFKNVLRLACSIYVAVYGILFTFGMVQITVHDLMIRLVKIGIINMLLSQNAWWYFYDTAVHFFNDGVDDIIYRVSTIAFDTGTQAGALVGQPFDPMDQAMVYVFSSKMAVTLLATFATGPYGFMIGIILLMSLGSFLKAILNALWVYVMGFVVRTLMFGLAPLFIVCILFSRTKHLFDGWLNQIVNASLQPIFLFTFFAFFVLLIKSCIEHLLDTPVCWTPLQSHSGTPGIAHFWRFAIHDCNNGEEWVPFDGQWTFTGPEGADTSCNTDVHPVGIILPLMIWILADLASRFNHIVIEIAKDLANASTDLTMGSDNIKRWFSQMVSGAEGAGRDGGSAGKTGSRNLGDLAKLMNNASGSSSGSGGSGGSGSGASLSGNRTGPGSVPPPGGSKPSA